MKKFIPKPPVKNLKTLLKVLASKPSFLHVIGGKAAFVSLVEFKWEGEERSQFAGLGFYEWRGTVEWPIKTAMKAVRRGLVVETSSYSYGKTPEDAHRMYKGIPY